jgi:tRNA modification GTPase
LLNALLNEEKAIVSDIPGTTRDAIEDVITLEGVSFRFIDTAGLRETEDAIEALGVARTHEKLKQAALVIYVVDLTATYQDEINKVQRQLEQQGVPFIMVGNKMDQISDDLLGTLKTTAVVPLSAKNKTNMEELKQRILEAVSLKQVSEDQTLVTNLRHYESLQETTKALDDVLAGIANGISNDLLALDIRQALHHLGEITGEITTDDLLENIFSKFCIGK